MSTDPAPQTQLVDPEREPIIRCREVTKEHPGGVHALRGVDLEVWPGDFTAIVGPSGSGKSTLLQIMGALDRPSSGLVQLGGSDIAELSDRALSHLRAQTIGFVFQRFHLSNLMTALDNVAEGLLYSGVRYSERRRHAVENLARLGMEHRLRHRPHTLSGGECQRVAIARALMGDPPVILADEPTGNLDSANGRAVVDILRTLANEGTAVVVVTHDRDLAARMDRHIEIRDGLVVDAGRAVTSDGPIGSSADARTRRG